MSRVLVAMSGGVDSSVVAALSVDAGHDPVGATMLLVPRVEDGSRHAEDAARACAALGIEHRVLDYRDRFEGLVVAPFGRAYLDGRTPNPCVWCNRLLKAGELLRYAREDGFDYLATGHYARIDRAEPVPRLLRGMDASRDQSYFLYAIEAEALDLLAFPLGDRLKADVRREARERGLPASSRPESREACFVPSGGYRDLLVERGVGGRPGPITDAEGRILGTHHGVEGFTVGQRRRLGVFGCDPLYVSRVIAAENRVVVGPVGDLRVSGVRAGGAVWHASAAEGECQAQVRYRQPPVDATFSLEDGSLKVVFEKGVQAAAPGQAVVCYKGDRVLGGGEIVDTW